MDVKWRCYLILTALAVLANISEVVGRPPKFLDGGVQAPSFHGWLSLKKSISQQFDQEHSEHGSDWKVSADELHPAGKGVLESGQDESRDSQESGKHVDIDFDSSSVHMDADERAAFRFMMMQRRLKKPQSDQCYEKMNACMKSDAGRDYCGTRLIECLAAMG